MSDTKTPNAKSGPTKALGQSSPHRKCEGRPAGKPISYSATTGRK